MSKDQKIYLQKHQAAKVIEAHFVCLQSIGSDDILCSARDAGRDMVHIYRLLTGEMPQSAGIHVEFEPLETPAIEFVSPNERDTNEVLYVQPGAQPGEPDIITKEYQDDNSKKGYLEEGDKKVEGTESFKLKG